MQVEFRTGYQEVPDYLADLMANLDTFEMTYEEAVRAVNQRLVADQLNKVQDDMLRRHMRERPWER